MKLSSRFSCAILALLCGASAANSVARCPKGFKWVQIKQQCLQTTTRLLPLRHLDLWPAGDKPSHVLLDKRDDTFVSLSASQPTSLQVDLGRRYTVSYIRVHYQSASTKQVSVTVLDEAGRSVGTGSLLPGKKRGTLDVPLRLVVAGVQKVPVGQKFQVRVSKALGDVRISDVSFWGGTDPSEILPANATIAWGLAVVVDFPNSLLEDYTEDDKAINHVADLRNYLDRMESHWRWMSHDRHQVEWAVERITVDQDFAPYAYGNNWVEFRKELAAKLLEKVQIRDYDSNADGDLDFAWFVLASKNVQDGDEGYLIMTTGVAIHDGVNIFVNGQGDFAVRFNAIGYWSYKAVHTNSIALGGQWGAFSNLGGVSVMSDVWRTPPVGLLAHELMKLGWIDVLRISEGSADFCLTPLEDKDSPLPYRAALIETNDPNEFFMLEYHKRPESGWGSGLPLNADGILITHILLTGSNFGGPLPYVRVESADGDLAYGDSATETDFWNKEDQVWDGSLYDRTPVASVSSFARETETKICVRVEFY